MIPATIAANTIEFSIDGVAMLFAASASVAMLLLFGLAPALNASSADLGAVAKGHASGTVGGRDVHGFRRVLATAQIAISLVLLVVAGLLVQSLINVTRVDLGLRVESVVTFTVSPGRNGYDRESILGLFERLEQELEAEPGVTHVAAASVRILSRNNWGSRVRVGGSEGRPSIDSNASMNHVDPGFFATLSIPLLAGRDFTLADRDGAAKVAVVNEAFVRKFGLGAAAVGKRLALEAGIGELDTEIVGVVGDAKYSEIKDEVPPQFFLPRLQLPVLGTLSFYVRAALPPEMLMQRIRPIVAGIDPTLPVQEIMPMAQVANENVFLDRLLSTVAASFAVLATLLAAAGLYGALAYGVTERIRELGLRLALGASPSDLRRLVLAQVGRMALVAIPLGLVVAVLAGRGAETLLYGVTGYDPLVLTAAVVLIGGVVLLAGLLPALAAARITPMDALRYE
jgi:predicted permease